MEKIEPPVFGRTCEYCPHTLESITIPDQKAAKLHDDSIPPTHIEIKCPECKNMFYYTQNRWYFSFVEKGFWDMSPEVEMRKTSPGKNIYVSKEDVINVE